MSAQANKTRKSRVGDVASMTRIINKLNPAQEPLQSKRKLVAEFCKMLGDQVGRPAPRGEGLPPRVQQTLERLLAGDSEKQIAAHLKLSQHTVHVYVKRLYRHYEVSSRGELFSRFVRSRTSPAAADGQKLNPDR